MSIFKSIVDKIFGSKTSAQSAASSPSQTAAPAAVNPPPQNVDVNALLSQMAAQHPEKLNWNSSIVDLLKLLNLDSSFASRKALAQELHYSGDSNDSATMNIWLHKQVMNKLAANGGQVPADLRV